MKYLALICLLIVCASAANTNKPASNKRKDGSNIQSRYDVPPGADLPGNFSLNYILVILNFKIKN